MQRFIPYRKNELVSLLCEDGKLQDEQKKQFQGFCKILDQMYNFEFHDKIEGLKSSYYPFNPDKDTQTTLEFSEAQVKESEDNLVKRFHEILNRANYEEITREHLERAMKEESLFKIQLYVDMDDFEDHLIYWRGDHKKKVEITEWMFWKKELDVQHFNRVAMLIKFKEKKYFEERGRTNLPFEPGSILIKLFKDIPQNDIEMLFPNTQIRMKLADKLIIGVPAALGGLGILSARGFAILAAVPVLFTVIKVILMGGNISDINSGDMAMLIAAGAALAAILAHTWKQWVKYKNRKIQFMKTLSESLYFKNLDNNMGVFYHLIDAAQDEECKEALLGYYFLLNQENTAKNLDKEIEQWFSQKLNAELNFEVDDALEKLISLGLCEKIESDEVKYKVLSLEEACEKLDKTWDNYFPYNKA